jgi:hypothetical protein
MNVTRAGYVDDRFEPDFADVYHSISPRLEEGDTAEIAGVKAFRKVDFELEEEEILRNALEEAFLRASAENRRRAYRQLVAPTPDDDVVVFDDLTGCWPTGMVPISPSAWAEWLNDAFSDDNRWMVFIDLDLGEDGGGDQGGVERLQELLSQDWPAERRPLAVIVTNKVAADSAAEEALWSQLSSASGLPPNAAVVVSKSRVREAETFPSRLRGVFLTNLVRDMSAWTRSIAESAISTAETFLSDVDAAVLEKVVIGSSEREGILPEQTLFRLFDREFLDQRLRLVALPERRARLTSFSSALVSLGKVKVEGDPPADSVAARRLRHLELYSTYFGADADDRPAPSNGDILACTFGDTVVPYILLAQPCDLILRQNGRRVARRAVLVPIHRNPSISPGWAKKVKDNAISEADLMTFTVEQRRFHRRLPWFFEDSEYGHGYLDYRRSRLVNLDAIDLCCLVDGKPQSLQEHALHAFKGVERRLKELAAVDWDSTDFFVGGEDEQPESNQWGGWTAVRTHRVSSERSHTLLSGLLEYRGRAAFEHEFAS